LVEQSTYMHTPMVLVTS